jgi:hypothetical protein
MFYAFYLHKVLETDTLYVEHNSHNVAKISSKSKRKRKTYGVVWKIDGTITHNIDCCCIFLSPAQKTLIIENVGRRSRHRNSKDYLGKMNLNTFYYLRLLWLFDSLCVVFIFILYLDGRLINHWLMENASRILLGDPQRPFLSKKKTDRRLSMRLVVRRKLHLINLYCVRANRCRYKELEEDII